MLQDVMWKKSEEGHTDSECEGPETDVKRKRHGLFLLSVVKERIRVMLYLSVTFSRALLRKHSFISEPLCYSTATQFCLLHTYPSNTYGNI